MNDPGPLVTVGELAALIGQENVRVADVRWYLGKPGAGSAAYAEGHITGATYVDLDSDLSDPDGVGAPGRHPLPSTQAFARRMGQLGFGSDDFIVAYDDAGGTIAARLWWMLDNLGHRGGVAVLDGGIQAWTADDLPLVTDSPRFSMATMELAADWHGVIEREALARRLGEVTLVDARAPERYRGDVEPVDPAAGHIPTAVNLPVANNLAGPGSGPLKSVDELRVVYDSASAGRPVVMSCGSGVTACHNALAMRAAGLPDPIVYIGSFSDWSRSGMPVIAGDEPGVMPR